MKISMQQFDNYQRSKPTFASNKRILKVNGELKNANITSFFRTDLDWENFITLISKKYKDAKKVNIYCHACSDGSEAYSLAMLLIERLGETEAKKFFPIIALDIDDKIIEAAQSKKVKISEYDLDLIKKMIGPNYSNYIQTDEKFSYDEEYRQFLCNANVLSPLYNRVIFERSDILKDISNLPSTNTILMCRNVWRYFTEQQYLQLVDAISRILTKSSMCVIGKTDIKKCNIDKLLSTAGLQAAPLENCFFSNAKEETTHINPTTSSLGFNINKLI